MSDSLITIIVIIVGTVLIFVFPLMTISERNVDVAQMSAQSAVTEFIDESCAKGEVTPENYDRLIQTLAATGNSYDIELEVKILDENPAKKNAQLETDKIGENLYYSVYTSQIEKVISEGKPFKLQEGWIFRGTAKNINKTTAKMLRGFFYSTSDSNASDIVAQHSALVLADG